MAASDSATLEKSGDAGRCAEVDHLLVSGRPPLSVPQTERRALAVPFKKLVGLMLGDEMTAASAVVTRPHRKLDERRLALKRQQAHVAERSRVGCTADASGRSLALRQARRRPPPRSRPRPGPLRRSGWMGDRAPRPSRWSIPVRRTARSARVAPDRPRSCRSAALARSPSRRCPRPAAHACAG